MNVPEQINLMCRRCGHNAGLRAPATALWHYATCIKCRYKEAVTEQVKEAA